MGTLATLSLLALQAQAQDDGYYIGLDFGNTKAEFTAKAGAISLSDDSDGGSQTLKVGKYLDNNSRVAIFYQNINADEANAGVLGIGYDYLIGEEPLKPFVGAFLGYGSYDLDDSLYGQTVDIAGMVYGIQAGVNYEINTNFSVEAGYRFMKSSMGDSIVYSGTNVDLEVDDIRNWFIGLNYKF